MKLFEDINETKTSQMWTYKVDGKDVDKEEITHRIESILVPETVDYLLNSKLLMNFSMMRSST